ncbi:MAG TPA: energy transducer TonB [Candidatus Angelobacter sp.]|nr:energy transducer TonB [Candidatus Angelobacter sp.]
MIARLPRNFEAVCCSRLFCSLLLLLLFVSVASPGLQAQTTEDNGTRKVKVKESPEYPLLARQNGIKGTARVMITIQPDGTVSDVKELGGHPLLVDSLSKAVKKWKYEKADKTSVIEVRASFGT